MFTKQVYKSLRKFKFVSFFIFTFSSCLKNYLDKVVLVSLSFHSNFEKHTLFSKQSENMEVNE